MAEARDEGKLRGAWHQLASLEPCWKGKPTGRLFRENSLGVGARGLHVQCFPHLITSFSPPSMEPPQQMRSMKTETHKGRVMWLNSHSREGVRKDPNRDGKDSFLSRSRTRGSQWTSPK